MATEYQENFDNNPLANFVLTTYIDGKLVPYQNINNLVIREYIYDTMPRIELQFFDNGLFVEMNPIIEGQELKIVAKLNAEADNIINQSFEILGASHQPTNPERTDNYVITVTAAYKLSKLIGPMENRYYSQMNFSNVVAEVGTLMNIKSNIKVTTNDKMTWYQPNQNYMDFLNASLIRANPGDNDTAFCYIGRDGILTVTSLRTELTQDSGITILNDPQNALTSVNNGSDNYFYTHAYSDKSGYFNKMQGYGVKYTYNDGSDIVENEITDYKSTKLSSFKNKNKLQAGQPVLSRNFGYINNVYDQYFDSIVRNKFIKDSFMSSPITLNVQAKSYKLFQKINIQIRSQSMPNTIVESYSGTYLIGGIIHHLSKKGTYDMILVLFRDGIDDSKAYNKFNNILEKS